MSGEMEAAKLETAAKQYEAYVRYAEALVDRRAEVNRFYLSLNTAIVGALGFLLKDGGGVGVFAAFLPAIPFVGAFICLIWRSILVSQRKVMKTKFDVIHELEKTLPARPYALEWEIFNQNKKGKPSFAKFELRLPIIFFLVYGAGFVFFSWPLGSRILDEGLEIVRSLAPA